MTALTSIFSVRSTSPPPAAPHRNSPTRLATKNSRWSRARLIPGQILRPPPNGIIWMFLLPVMSTPSPSPPGRNLSGRNSSGSGHISPSRCILTTAKPTLVPLGMVYPPREISSDGWRRSPSRTTAFRTWRTGRSP
ncbi:unnamed protein product [Spirodela intermedia]|uniref:Uncharacterized protein n=1 Tax=Spirodela intermedia TaxID=51605 RepID=A0A7I8LB81_SPIIN|nr:unnamed protein product [Spirodela intermedia]